VTGGRSRVRVRATLFGSVRQLADDGGDVTLAQSFEPYGDLLTSAGTGTTSYGFTGEQFDGSTGLLYLRARYYAGGVGRFVTRDTWAGNHFSPQSLNAWIYVAGNPVNLLDPSGHWAVPSGGGPDDDSSDDTFCEQYPILCEQPGLDPLADLEEIIQEVCPFLLLPLQLSPNVTLNSQSNDNRARGNQGKRAGLSLDVGDLVGKVLRFLPPNAGVTQICKNDPNCIKVLNEATTKLKSLKQIGPFQNVGLGQAEIGDDVINYAVGSRIKAADALQQFAWKYSGPSAHSENMILQDVAARYVNNPGAQGTVRIFSYLGPCPSCQGAINEFTSRFPGINVVIGYIIPYSEYIQRGSPAIPIP
jgi:RHS repeat-associated protein